MPNMKIKETQINPKINSVGSVEHLVSYIIKNLPNIKISSPNTKITYTMKPSEYISVHDLIKIINEYQIKRE